MQLPSRSFDRAVMVELRAGARSQSSSGTPVVPPSPWLNRRRVIRCLDRRGPHRDSEFLGESDWELGLPSPTAAQLLASSTPC